MIVNFDGLSAGARYALMTQTLLPRPVAWALSQNPDGGVNIAPFSYFNAVCSDPPLIMMSLSDRPQGGGKDTSQNIGKGAHFVVNIASFAQREAVNASSASLPRGQSEAETLGLKLAPFKNFPLPRVADSPAAFACEFHRDLRLGGAQNQRLIFGRVLLLHLRDDVAAKDEKGRLKIDAKKMNPLARLGAGEYGALGEVVQLARPE